MGFGNVIDWLLGSDDEPSGAAALKAALVEPRTDVDYEGRYQEPELDTTGAPTAVFPVQVYDAETGNEYTETAVEFPIESDSGKVELRSFLDAHGLTRDTLDEIEGAEASVRRNNNGTIEVNW